MKKEKLFKNKKRGQGFAEYALLIGGIMIIIAGALVLLRQAGIFNHVGRYIRCVLRVATSNVGGTDVAFAGCNACLTPNGTYNVGNPATNYCGDS